MKKNSLILLQFFCSAFLFPQQFTELTSVNLTGVKHGSAVWGDYDNDGDLDILLSGEYDSTGVSKIYRNDGNSTFTEQTSISMTGVYRSSGAWGDYDNDGDLDILLTGRNGSERLSKIYKNNGDNSFTEQTSILLTGVYNGSVAWGDYDNDGDLDILLTGNNIFDGNEAKIYRNNGNNTFTEQTSIVLAHVGSGSVAWGDYDNDGDLDILLSGDWFWPVSKIYRNEGNNSFAEQPYISLTLMEVGMSSVAWGDYDNDGDLDILLTGRAESYQLQSKIYRNNGNNTFSEQSSITLVGVENSRTKSSAWGDYDNDGDLDILLTGYDGLGRYSAIYRNNGDNTFTEMTSINLIDVFDSCVDWGDYDNDGDLDILLTGSAVTGSVTKIYRNNNITPNTLPITPSNLQSAVNDQDVTFSWDKSTDNETPQNGLRYNLVIGTTSNAVNTLSPMSDRNTGYRRVINLGNTNHNNSWTIKGLDSEQTYYWSVQAVDNCFTASEFAPEQFVLITSVDGDKLNKLPIAYELMQNFPNPFNPSTTVRYSIINPELVQIKIYDILGREVKILVNELKRAGSYEVQFDATGLASGMYLYRIESGSFIQMKKMILLR